MPYNPQIHHRRSIRLKNYDYTQPGAYFITICTKGKQCLFGDIIEGKMRLNALGSIADSCWRTITDHFSHVAIDVYVIMPNHVHGILMIADRETRQGNVPTKTEQFGQPVKGSIPTIIRTYKATVTKQINTACQTQSIVIWQRNYYEHICRQETELNYIRQYIKNNPQSWHEDSQYPRLDRNIAKSDRALTIDIPF